MPRAGCLRTRALTTHGESIACLTTTGLRWAPNTAQRATLFSLVGDRLSPLPKELADGSPAPIHRDGDGGLEPAVPT